MAPGLIHLIVFGWRTETCAPQSERFENAFPHQIFPWLVKLFLHHRAGERKANIRVDELFARLRLKRFLEHFPEKRFSLVARGARQLMERTPPECRRSFARQ